MVIIIPVIIRMFAIVDKGARYFKFLTKQLSKIGISITAI